MRRLLRSTIVISVFAGMLTTGAATAEAATCTYQASQHPVRPGDNFGAITGTDGGQYFVGWSAADNPTHPYPHGTVWKNGTPIADFGALGTAAGVNTSGDAAGNTFSRGAVVRNGQLSELASPASPAKSIPWVAGITDDGLVIGEVRLDDGTYRILTWRVEAPGSVNVLSALTSWTLKDVSDNGHVVGTTTSNGVQRAVAGTVNGLTPLNGVAANANSTATDIAGSYILGTGTIPGGNASIIVWNNGVASAVAGGGTATDINNSGIISGKQTVDGQRRGFVVRDGVRTTLQPLAGYPDAEAETVTDDGRVAGLSWRTRGADKNYERVPTVWTCA